jgi:hypothetical protein
MRCAALLLALGGLLNCGAQPTPALRFRALIFSKTAGYRHEIDRERERGERRAERGARFRRRRNRRHVGTLNVERSTATEMAR